MTAAVARPVVVVVGQTVPLVAATYPANEARQHSGLSFTVGGSPFVSAFHRRGRCGMMCSGDDAQGATTQDARLLDGPGAMQTRHRFPRASPSAVLPAQQFCPVSLPEMMGGQAEQQAS
jgi:hypothetical protein